ncbi:MAG TPA: helicase-associated domain-containing protein [Myxococcota bacterium]|nr:helicase-associated domain-containing protein [Myxococcota bacterium]
MDASEMNGDDGGGRRRRRRRRRGSREEAPEAPPQEESSSHGPRRGRRLARDEGDAPGVTLPGTGKLHLKPRIHRRRARPAAGMARRRRFGKVELEDLVRWFSALPDPLLASLYKALGGQPGRVSDHDRMVQLMVRAIAQGNRLSGLLSQLHQRDRQALAALVQCGGLAHADEFQKELVLMLGGRESDWARTLATLGDKGIIFASDNVENGFYYLVPEPLIEHLAIHLESELALPTFQHDDIRVPDQRPFCPPLDFSVATLATYLQQKPPRLTQRQEVFKAHKDELDRFFSQIWPADSELFNLHYDFLMMHGMVELRGDRIAVNSEVVEEWLNLEPEDQRDLIFRTLEKRFPLAEWVLWAVHTGKGEWIPEAPLQALYRRWRRGEDWRERFHKNTYASPRGAEREGFSFNALVLCGILEMGLWGQQKFFRLSPRALRLLEPPADEGFTQFYLTPNYEIIAPAGLAPVLLFRIGELAELVGCDRANTYRITEISVEQALKLGWRREEILDFLRENSQIGLPENVERQLRSWMGQDGDVEFHEIFALTVHRSLVRRIESVRNLKPYLLHRFAPGLYAVDKKRMPELAAELQKAGFAPSREIRRYPADEITVEARGRLHMLLAEARDDREDPVARAHSADTQPEDLRPIPGSTLAQGLARKERRQQGPPRITPEEAKEMAEKAISDRRWLQMEYLSTKDQSRKEFIVVPERVALNREGALVLVATEITANQRLSFALAQILRLRSVEGKL